jgi:hypothetical protein
VSERVFLDANILVAAAWRGESGLVALWQLTGIQLLTSGCAIVEADRMFAGSLTAVAAPMS